MMTKKQIIGSIMAATGQTVEGVAKQHGYTKHAFYYTISGRTRGRKVRAIISGLVGKPEFEIWPETVKGKKK